MGAGQGSQAGCGGNSDNFGPAGRTQKWLRTLQVESIDNLPALREKHGPVDDIIQPGKQYVVLLVSPEGHYTIGDIRKSEQWFMEQGMIGIYDAKTTHENSFTIHQGKPFKKVNQGPGYNK